MIVALLKDPLEAGVFIALATYGLILAWSLLARLNWLPGAILHPVHRLLSRLQRQPLLGRAVGATRRHPLTLGLLQAILVGILVPALAISLAFLFMVLAFMAAMYVAIRYGDWGEPEEDETYPCGLYYERYTNNLVDGSSPYADLDRPSGPG